MSAVVNNFLLFILSKANILDIGNRLGSDVIRGEISAHFNAPTSMTNKIFGMAVGVALVLFFLFIGYRVIREIWTGESKSKKKLL